MKLIKQSSDSFYNKRNEGRLRLGVAAMAERLRAESEAVCGLSTISDAHVHVGGGATAAVHEERERRLRIPVSTLQEEVCQKILQSGLLTVEPPPESGTESEQHKAERFMRGKMWLGGEPPSKRSADAQTAGQSGSGQSDVSTKQFEVTERVTLDGEYFDDTFLDIITPGEERTRRALTKMVVDGNFGAAGLDMPALSIVPSAKNFDELVAFHCQWAEDEKWAKNALFVPGDPRVEIRPYNKAEQAGIKGRFVNLYDVSRITVEIQRTKTILDQHVGGKHIFAHGQYKHPASNRAPQGRDQLLLKLFTGRRKLQEHVSDTYRWAPPEAPVVTYSAGGLRTEASRYMSHPYVRAATVDDAEVARAQVHIVGAPPTSI